ncbi:DUF1552 domain-containing protein [Botrimarina hoheduenensis]|uniref:DUF1552 domain-containing protein n=1 Tax=Botrimarina hoheduenensis TaxID=2528000 RepID=A0A5C5VX16_9BACT|nr:DUF1552 domain-containing protein [Botrimarina hoheduenensis]TWT42940.1 hypothetical protein Pla111_25780 [Botrimarina hoheduenensis]
MPLMTSPSRREFLRVAGLSPALAPLLANLSAFATAPTGRAKQRLVIIFSPNGIIPDNFWPPASAAGEPLELPKILEPLAPHRDRTLVLKGLCNQINGDGDGHMRGIGCLLTGVELLPGNVQGGSHTPAGWSSGNSIDQEIREFLQKRPETRTRFGSLEFGVYVPDTADTWTRMVYAGRNKPIAPIDDPYQMLGKLYGDARDRKALGGILDAVSEDFAKVRSLVSEEDRRLLDEHASMIRDMERQLAADAASAELNHIVPELESGVSEKDENMPKLSRMQIELMVNSFACDFARVATLQYTRSVGQARMAWLGVEERHHELSHRPDTDLEAVESLTRINRWYCEEVARLATRLAETPEPDGSGSLLDNTLIVWTNELGKGNSHTRDNIPFVLVGGTSQQSWGLRGGRAIDFGKTPHNRLLMWLANAFDHPIKSFGNADFCGEGALSGLV